MIYFKDIHGILHKIHDTNGGRSAIEIVNSESPMQDVQDITGFTPKGAVLSVVQGKLHSDKQGGFTGA